MKIRFCAALLLAALALFALTGCQSSAMDTLDNLEETIENRLDRAGDAIERAMEPPATQAATESRLTPEEAEAIALNHAGVTRDDVSYLRTEFDFDEGRPEYDIDFVCGDWEYDYGIHGRTGELLHSEMEPVEKKKPAPTEPAATETAVQTAAPERLTEAEATDIALKDAGLTKDQVTRLRAEFDYDDGRPEYEVDFHHDGWEYDYEIHAETGKILSRDKDRED